MIDNTAILSFDMCFFDFSSVVSSGNFIFQSKLMQKVTPKDTDRFKFIIHMAGIKVNPELKHVEAVITHAFQGKSKTTILVKSI